MRVLVAGATELVLLHVLKRLVARGDYVRVLAPPEMVETLQDYDCVDIVVGSLTDSTALAEAAEGVDVVYHLGALLSSDLHQLIGVNVHGTESLLQASVTGRVGRFVFISTVAVYSPAPSPSMWPLIEDSPLRAHGENHLRNYGQSKIDGENLVRRFHREHALEYVILRPPAIYGPEAVWFRQLLQRLMRNPRQAFSPGAQAYSMQWVHVEDLAEGIVLAGTRPEAANNVFNVAGDEVFTARDILAAVRKVRMGPGARPARRPVHADADRNADLKYSIGKAQRRLGFTPKVQLAEGIQETLPTMDQHHLFTRRSLS
jgi:nucleoside-diphosphate-sugar epimerase